MDNVLGILLGLILVIVLFFGLGALTAWPVMLFLGNAAATGAPVTALGYSATFWLVLAVQTVLFVTTAGSNASAS